MRDRINDLISNLSNRLVPGVGEEQSLHNFQAPSILETVEQAKKEWLDAKSYFESVSDPELVDYSIYVMEAAERKYMYLLKKARENGVCADLIS